jgi:hypothetical protein
MQPQLRSRTPAARDSATARGSSASGSTTAGGSATGSSTANVRPTTAGGRRGRGRRGRLDRAWRRGDRTRARSRRSLRLGLLGLRRRLEVRDCGVGTDRGDRNGVRTLDGRIRSELRCSLLPSVLLGRRPDRKRSTERHDDGQRDYGQSPACDGTARPSARSATCTDSTKRLIRRGCPLHVRPHLGCAPLTHDTRARYRVSSHEL